MKSFNEEIEKYKQLFEKHNTPQHLPNHEDICPDCRRGKKACKKCGKEYYEYPKVKWEKYPVYKYTITNEPIDIWFRR